MWRAFETPNVIWTIDDDTRVDGIHPSEKLPRDQTVSFSDNSPGLTCDENRVPEPRPSVVYTDSIEESSFKRRFQVFYRPITKSSSAVLAYSHLATFILDAVLVDLVSPEEIKEQTNSSSSEFDRARDHANLISTNSTELLGNWEQVPLNSSISWQNSFFPRSENVMGSIVGSIPENLDLNSESEVPPAQELQIVDACGGSFSISPEEFRIEGRCTNNYTIVRIWRYTDRCFISDSLVQVINVNDSEIPQIIDFFRISEVACPSDTTYLAATTCDPSQVGVSQVTLSNVFGCDSVVITTTTLLPNDTTYLAATTCDPSQIGVSQVTLSNVFGCDSVVITTTTLLPNDTTYLAATTCDPSQVGVSQVTLSNVFGCDSIVITTTTLLPNDTTNLAATTCDPSQVGVSQVTLSNAFGCDSVVITTTTLLPNDTTYLAATTCDPSQVGVFQKTLPNVFGCDSVVITTTTLLPNDTTYLAATTCDPSQVGVFQKTLPNVFGCDSIVITTTTLLPNDTTYLAARTCDPSQVGVFQKTLPNVFGCDSVVITTTTLLPLADAGEDNSIVLCSGQTIDLTTLVSGSGGTFNDPGATGGLSGTIFSATGLAAGTYLIQYIVVSGNICPDDTASIYITVGENPICTITRPTDIVCGTSSPNNNLFAHATYPSGSGSGGFTYNWKVKSGSWTINGSSSGQSVNFLTDAGTAVFEVTVTDANGCSTICDIILNCIEADDEYCTLSQGFYGESNGKQFGQNTLQIIQNSLNKDIDGDGTSDPLVLGLPGRSLTFDQTTSQCIINLLPGSASPKILPSSLGDWTVNASNCSVGTIQLTSSARIKNILLTQTISLMLNVRYDPTLRFLTLKDISCFSSPNIYIRDWVMMQR